MFSTIRHGLRLGWLGVTCFVPFHGLSAAAAPSEVSVNLVDALSITKIQDLSLGTILPGITPGHVEIDERDGACAGRGGATLVGNRCQPAQFRISGRPGERVRIGLSPAPITLTRTGGGATMQMDRLRLHGGGNERIEANGSYNFIVGGRLQVGANQLPGVYDATFNVTVEYR